MTPVVVFVLFPLIFFSYIFVSVIAGVDPVSTSNDVFINSLPTDQLSDPCRDRSIGFYCDPAYPNEILQCPENIKKSCPFSRKCLSIGKVPDCYYCEIPFDLDEFCKKMIGGLFCPAPETGSFKNIIECKSYKFTRLIECPEGSVCYSPLNNPLRSMCLLGSGSFCPYVSTAERFVAQTIVPTQAFNQTIVKNAFRVYNRTAHQVNTFTNSHILMASTTSMLYYPIVSMNIDYTITATQTVTNDMKNKKRL